MLNSLSGVARRAKTDSMLDVLLLLPLGRVLTPPLSASSASPACGDDLACECRRGISFHSSLDVASSASPACGDSMLGVLLLLP